MSKPKFKAGDIIRDRATGTVVIVNHRDIPNPQLGNPANGFGWINHEKKHGEPGQSGFCPHASDGCYELVPPTRRERIAAVLRKNLPTLARLFRKRELENRESLHDLGHELYGRHDYRDGWQAQVCRPYGEPYLAFEDDPPYTSQEICDEMWRRYGTHTFPNVPTSKFDPPTREQILAATVAGAAIGGRGEANETYFDPGALARYARLTAREIISQSERSGGTETSPDKSG